jgi:hypothetical protein
LFSVKPFPAAVDEIERTLEHISRESDSAVLWHRSA